MKIHLKEFENMSKLTKCHIAFEKKLIREINQITRVPNNITHEWIINNEIKIYIVSFWHSYYRRSAVLKTYSLCFEKMILGTFTFHG